MILRTLLLAALAGAAALLANALSGNPASGWMTFSLLLLFLLLWRGWRMHQVARWAVQPESTPPPPDVGAWDDVLAPIYRYQRKQQRDLAESREDLANMTAAAQALPDGVVTLNKDFHIKWCNRAARQHLGLRLPTDQGRSLLNLLRLPEFVAYARQRDWPEPVLLRLDRKDQRRAILLQITAYGANQRLLISRDVTQLEKLETMRRDFVANVSHELRTPLTVLSGFLETLRDAPENAISAAQQAQYLQMMHEQARRMQAIVEDLLTLSTLESSPSTEPAMLHMPLLLEQARQQAEALSNGRHVFSWHIDQDLDLLGSASEISSAVSNLLTNAVRYTPDGGGITVRWEADAENNARYSVRDTGIGIAAHHIPRLTERFYRVDRGRSRAAGGTGLGLAITKHIAMRHDATLTIESELGKGSTFALSFPPERVTRGAAQRMQQ